MAGTPKSKLEQYAAIQPMVQKDIETKLNSMFESLYKQYATKYGVASTPLHTHNGLDSPRINAWDLSSSLGTSGSITFATDGQRYRIGLNTKVNTGFAPSLIRFNGIAIYSVSTFTISSSSVTAGAVYEVEGLRFTVLTTISPDTTLVTAGPGGALTDTSATLTKVSGSGPSTINFSNVSVSNTRRSLVVGDAFLGPSFYLQPDTDSMVTVGGLPEPVVQSSSFILINDSGSGPVTLASVSEGHIVSVVYPTVNDIVARATIPDLGSFGANDNPISAGTLSIDVELAAGWSIIGNVQIT
jgi:hypothetical protein